MWVCYGDTHKVLMWDNSLYYRCSSFCSSISKSLLLRLRLNAWLFSPVLWKQKPFWGQTHSDNSDQMTETHVTYWLHVAVSQQTITTCKTTRPSAQVSSVSTNWQICRCIVHVLLGTWKCFPCNHILRKTVGKPQAVMWNKCHTSVCTKIVLSWSPTPQTWADGVSESGRLEGSPVVGGGSPPPTSPVSWVSAPGGQGHSLGGCWQVCSPDDISSHYWSFYSCSCSPAYSGELGLALCARAWVCSDMR